MPEGLEAEIYRRAAERCVGRRISTVEVDDLQPTADELRSVLPGRRIVGSRRHGKLVLLDTADGGGDGADAGRLGLVTLGLHFGMTGRLIVDDVAAIDQLEYSSGRDDPTWDRFVLRFDDDGALRVNDPRRLARFELDPDETRLGPDVLSLDIDQLRAALARRRAPIKAVLLDQSAVAGFGNMTVDEVLWRAGIAPTAPADRIGPVEIERIVEATRATLPAMLERGGSHTGTIDPEVRAAVPPCPRDGAPMRRDRVGGRTTIWCPVHQVVPADRGSEASRSAGTDVAD